jgi:hypothetical protein
VGLGKHIANRFALGQLGLPTTLSKLVKVIINSAVDTGEQLQVTGAAVWDGDPLNAIHYGTTAPASPKVGKRWLDSTSGILYEYINDGDTSQWVEASAAAPPAPLGRNVVINGDFNVWQRGTTFTGPSSGAYHADRWLHSRGGAVVPNISRSTDVPSVSIAGRLLNYSCKLDIATADASIAAGDFLELIQPVEGYNWLPLAQRNVIVSFLVKSPKTGIHCVAISNKGVDRSLVMEYTVNAANTWEKKTVAFTASPSAGTWDYTNLVGAYLRFALSAGSTFHTTAGSWQSGNFIATSNQVNCSDSTSNSFLITGVQLEAGDQATEFETVPYVTQLLRCKRYYFRDNYATSDTIAIGQNYDTQNCVFEYGFPMEMRANPTVSVSAQNHMMTLRANAAAEDVTAIISFTGANKVRANVATNSANMTVGQAVRINASATMWIAGDAEL